MGLFPISSDPAGKGRNGPRREVPPVSNWGPLPVLAPREPGGITKCLPPAMIEGAGTIL